MKRRRAVSAPFVPSRFGPPAAVAALLVLLVGLSHPAAAQTPPGLKTHFRLENSMPNGTPPGELRVGDGWTSAGPLVTVGSNHVSNPQGMYSNSDFTAVADYGYLHFYGFGSAQTYAPNGCFLWVDGWIGAEPRAQYRDRLTVSSATLPAGTPVVVEFRLELSGSTTIVDSNPSSSFSASLIATHTGPQLSLSLADAPGVTSGLVDTWVGDTIDVNGRLMVYLYAYGIMGSYPVYASVAADVTAQVDATPLTAGVWLTSSSGPVGAPEVASGGDFALAGAWPNPIRATPVTIRFTLPSSDPATLSLFDLGGRRIAEVPVGGLGAGSHAVDLAGGQRLASGVYFVRLSRGPESRTSRVVVLD